MRTPPAITCDCGKEFNSPGNYERHRHPENCSWVRHYEADEYEDYDENKQDGDSND